MTATLKCTFQYIVTIFDNFFQINKGKHPDLGKEAKLE